MVNRHLSRSIVLQSLFEWDASGGSHSDIAETLKRNIEEFASDTNDTRFMEDLAAGVLAKQKDIDLIITKAAPEWPLEKISVVDRNILRIGLFELLFGDRSEVPPKVAINEAIELAKSFGGDSSGRFVNGVLGAIYKEIGEPGKNDSSKKRAEMPLQNLGGAVVYAREGDDVYLAMVHDIFGHWTLAKGKLEEGETVEEGTKREIKEEIGLDIELKEKIGENEYIASHPEKGKFRKRVTYFLAEAPFEDLVLEQKGGLDDAKWFKLQDILELNLYRDMLPVVTIAVQKLAAGDPST